MSRGMEVRDSQVMQCVTAAGCSCWVATEAGDVGNELGRYWGLVCGAPCMLY